MSMLNDSFDNIKNNDCDDENDEFYDSETEPSILLDTSLNISDSSILEQSFQNQSLQQQEQTYYAVQFLDKTKIDTDGLSKQIFMKREHALKLCKKYALNSRFKVCRSFQEAYSFSYESDMNLLNGKSKQEGTKTPSDAESLPFPRPTTRDLNEFRSLIEKNDLNLFKKKVLANPRYLVSSGDSPVIIKESCRYNSLHICAIENKSLVCEFILDTLNANFIRLLYVNDTIDQAKLRVERVLDLYLNTPEKGFHETPLHFACKYGSYDVVKLLLKHELCSKTVVNKQNQTPFDIICTKYNKNDREAMKTKIKSLFEDCFYVPFYLDDEKLEVIVAKPVKEEKIIEIKASPNSPNNIRTKKLTAFVGPTSPVKANIIYERLKSPSSLKSSPNHKDILDVLRSDDYKGYERIARKVSEEIGVPFYEHWEFLGCFCETKQNELLMKLENYLMQKKFENLINSQIKSIDLIKSTLKLQDTSELYIKLENLLKLINNLKDYLGIKENFLSKKFESTQLIKEKLLKYEEQKREEFLNIKNNKTSLLAINDIYEFLKKIEAELELDNLHDLINNYLNEIVNLIHIDLSSIVYFYLYKSSKLLINFLNYKQFINDLYLTSFFKKIELNQTSKIAKKVSNFNGDVLKNALKSLKLDDKSKNEINDICLKFDKIIFYENEDDDYDDLIKRQNIKSKQYNGFSKKKIESNSNEASDDENSDGFSLKFHKNENICKYIDNLNYKKNKSHVNKLFIFGDAPSKIDFAVYLAIKDMTIDSKEYPTLQEWFNFMKKHKYSDMKSWKTPMRRQIK